MIIYKFQNQATAEPKGVREYWIVDPKKNRITVWNFVDEIMEEYTFLDSVPAGIYPDFGIDFSKLNS